LDERQAASLRAYLAQRGISVPGTGGFTPDQMAALMQMLTQPPPPSEDAATATPMFAAAVGVHELFKVLTAAGFTEDQALKYLAYAATSGSGG
jgi:hypothetical protein